MQILFIEDDPLIGWTVSKSLEELGCHVVNAECCKKAIEIWQTSHFDMVICDFRLPDGVGTDVVSEMRQRGRLEPVIFITAERELISARTQRKLQIDTLLPKPLNIDDLKSIISRTYKANHKKEQGRVSQQTRSKLSHAGRFTVIKCSPFLTVQELIDVSNTIKAPDWIALDMSEVQKIADDFPAELISQSRSKRACNGRICVVNVSRDIKGSLTDSGATFEVDILENLKALGPHGRRLHAKCERDMLLKTSVLREGQA